MKSSIAAPAKKFTLMFAFFCALSISSVPLWTEGATIQQIRCEAVFLSPQYDTLNPQNLNDGTIYDPTSDASVAGWFRVVDSKKIVPSSSDTRSLENLRTLLNNGLQGYKTIPKTGEQYFASQWEVAEWGAQITPRDRAALLESLKKLNIAGLHEYTNKDAFNAFKLLSLVLHDRRSWLDYIQTMAKAETTYGNDEFLSSWHGTLGRAARDLPIELKMELLEKVRTKYSRAEKHSYSKRYGPKRALDAFLRWALRGDTIFKQAIAEGKSVVEAYDTYLTISQFYSGRSKTANYSAKDIIAAAKAAQTILTQEKLRNLNLKIQWFGSFPNGKALLKSSDIDTMSLADPIRWEVGDEVMAAVNQALSTPSRRSRLTLQLLSVEAFPKGHVAEINPFGIEISADAIRIQVYPEYFREESIDGSRKVVFHAPELYDVSQ